jgi:hypothetical protein
VLPTGRILLIAGSGNKEDMFNAGTFKSLVYDPATGRSRVVPTPDDMFCAGHAFLGNGNLLVAGGTQRYERLDGAVTHAAGGLTVKNEDPDAVPRTFPAGTEFRSPEGLVYRATHPFTVQPAAKLATRRGRAVGPGPPGRASRRRGRAVGSPALGAPALGAPARPPVAVRATRPGGPSRRSAVADAARSGARAPADGRPGRCGAGRRGGAGGQLGIGWV